MSSGHIINLLYQISHFTNLKIIHNLRLFDIKKIKNFIGKQLHHGHDLKRWHPGVMNCLEQCKLCLIKQTVYDLYIVQAHNQYTVTFNVLLTCIFSLPSRTIYVFCATLVGPQVIFSHSIRHHQQDVHVCMQLIGMPLPYLWTMMDGCTLLLMQQFKEVYCTCMLACCITVSEKVG